MRVKVNLDVYSENEEMCKAFYEEITSGDLYNKVVKGVDYDEDSEGIPPGARLTSIGVARPTFIIYAEEYFDEEGDFRPLDEDMIADFIIKQLHLARQGKDWIDKCVIYTNIVIGNGEGEVTIAFIVKNDEKRSIIVQDYSNKEWLCVVEGYDTFLAINDYNSEYNSYRYDHYKKSMFVYCDDENNSLDVFENKENLKQLMKNCIDAHMELCQILDRERRYTSNYLTEISASLKDNTVRAECRITYDEYSDSIKELEKQENASEELREQENKVVEEVSDEILSIISRYNLNINDLTRLLNQDQVQGMNM